MSRSEVFAFLLEHPRTSARVILRDLGDVTRQILDLMELGMVFEYDAVVGGGIQVQMIGVRQKWR
jgi:hypothetical protein